MDRIDALRAAGKGKRADPADETVINGTPYYPANAFDAAPSRMAYREEYLRSLGPAVDQWLDGVNPDRNAMHQLRVGRITFEVEGHTWHVRRST
jgi:hypothetical protein